MMNQYQLTARKFTTTFNVFELTNKYKRQIEKHHFPNNF